MQLEQAGVADALHMRSILMELDVTSSVNITIFTDSTSGKSIASAFGISKRTRHVQLRYLFLQELVQSGMVRLKKVFGTRNPADIFTKYLQHADMAKHLTAVGILNNRENYDISLL